MRIMSLLIAGTILASCNMAPPPPQAPSPTAVREYQQLVAGKVAQRPVDCLPNYSSNNQTVIDGRTLGFRVGSGSSTAYIVQLTPGCEMVTSGPYALLSRQFGGMGMCRGDIQQVIDTMNRGTVGSCTVASITPYIRR